MPISSASAALLSRPLRCKARRMRRSVASRRDEKVAGWGMIGPLGEVGAHILTHLRADAQQKVRM
jgi:hypothetical protein